MQGATPACSVVRGWQATAALRHQLPSPARGRGAEGEGWMAGCHRCHSDRAPGSSGILIPRAYVPGYRLAPLRGCRRRVPRLACPAVHGSFVEANPILKIRQGTVASRASVERSRSWDPKKCKTPCRAGGLLRGADRIRTDDGGFAIRCLSHLATAPFVSCPLCHKGLRSL